MTGRGTSRGTGRGRRLSIAAMLAALIAATPAAGGGRILVFGFEIADTSGEGARPGHDAWLEAASERFAARLREAGYEVPAPRMSPPGETPIRSCNGCEARIAASAGADLAATGTVHKVSTLVLSITISLRDVASGEAIGWAADIRGDNERSWLRGVDWLVEHRVLPYLEERPPDR